jgi:uncharacterized protein YjdB
MRVGDPGFALDVTLQPEDTAVKSLEWSSSDPAVAAAGSGMVYAVSEGTAVITARTWDGTNLTASVRVTVLPRGPAVQEITPGTQTATSAEKEFETMFV